jgi:hypothetical protein
MDDRSIARSSKISETQRDLVAEARAMTTDAGKTVESTIKAQQASAMKENFLSEAEDNSAMGIQIRTKKIEIKKELKSEKAKQAQESVLVRKEEADGLADGFSRRQGNREYRLDFHLLSELAEDLGIGINENATAEEIIAFVRRRLSVDGQSPDVVIIDKAFEFLIEVSQVQIGIAEGQAKERLGNILSLIESAKFKHFEQNTVEIQVAQKIIGAVDAVVERTGRSVKETLNQYREIVHNPPELQTLRKFYEVKGYKAMILELKGLSAYLGGNFKRSNLESPELGQLASAARKMQALLGVFRQSKTHIPTMESYLKMNGVLEAA